MLLPIIAAVVYFLQFKVSQIGNQNEQAKQMAFLGYLSPIMMGAFALFAPAAISLYWVTGGVFMIAQSYLLGKLYKLPPAASNGAVEIAASAGKG
jgi:YidC/Oxa1 family membrane protein insertase